MKKNITMRIAAFLFILTMISTCAFATTFAKYTTTGSSSDEARVAKFGVTISAPTATNLFKGQYEVEDTSTTVDGGLAVKASTAGDVVAPGTSGQLAAFTVKGTPEVAVEVKYEAVLTLSGWLADGAEYCPIVFTINSTEYKQEADETVAAFAARVSAAINNSTRVNAPNVEINDSFAFSWEWAFDGDDAKDTALGNLDTAPTISLTISCTVTQID